MPRRGLRSQPMRKVPLSSTRRMMFSLFDEPANDPYVCINFDVEIARLRGFLDAYTRVHGVRVGVNHAVTKSVARCLRELPAMNVRIIERTIYALDRVDIAMPVHLGARDGASGANGRDETGMTIVRDVDRRTLSELAEETRRNVVDERGGGGFTKGTGLLRKALRHVPDAVVRRAFEGVGWLTKRPTTWRVLESQFGVSSVVTNLGAVLATPKGMRFRAASFSLPNTFGHLASAFAVAPTEDAAIVDGATIDARTVLPITMIVDHRAVDGVLMAKAATAVARGLLEPDWMGAP